jgi:hypothetical protein
VQVLKIAAVLSLAVLVATSFISPTNLVAAPVGVLHREGISHGFLVVRARNGRPLGYGELIQSTRDEQVTMHFTLHFKDGSIHDETTVYSQRGSFRLFSDHLVQKGPSFPHPMEVSIDAAKHEFKVHYTDNGKEKDESENVDVPEDAANGLMLNLVKNVAAEMPQTTVSMVAPTPKSRIVKLVISPGGKRSFSIGGPSLQATDFVVKVEIGGVAGAVAPLVGKQPSDTHVWVYGGDAPAVVRFEGALYEGGPIWKIEPANFVFH